MREIVEASDWLVSESMDRAGYRGLRISQLRVLTLIDEGVNSPAELARIIGTTQQWVSKCVRILLDHSCIELWSHPVDRRRTLAALTDSGRRALKLTTAWTRRFEGYGPATLEEDLQAMLTDFYQDLQRNSNPAVRTRSPGD